MSFVYSLVIALAVIFACANALCSDYAKNQRGCMTATEDGVKCAFCSSAAAGTTCLKESDAQSLPTSIFQCSYQAAVSSTPSLNVTGAYYGVDISTAVSSSSASCFKSGGYSFIVPRGYRSTGSVDTNVCTSLKNAYSAGIGARDVYMFPQPTGTKSASTQMGELVNYLNANCKSQWSGRIWLDIEGTSYWSTSYSTNKNFYQALVQSCSTYGVRCGVYSSYYQWQSIFGSTSYCYGQANPIWYAHYDNNPSFSDFSSFGCWTTPHAKQYAGDVTVCSMGVDKNYSPGF